MPVQDFAIAVFVMLYYCCARQADLPVIRRRGLEADEAASGIRLWPTLDEAGKHCGDAVLVLASEALEEVPKDRTVARVPPEALRNADPYLPPRPVAAAGGYVVRPAETGGLEVLLIYRRGVWDLPKGKRDDGESLEACALREVREETGVRTLRAVCSLSTTVHGYAREGAYCVKTTHWFLMRTPETRFTPQQEEDIEQVAWVPWPEALRSVGYATLRRHMQQAEPVIRANL